MMRLLVWGPHFENHDPNSLTFLDYFPLSLPSPQLMTLILIFSKKIIEIKTELLYILTISVVWYLRLYLDFLSSFLLLMQ